MIQSLKAQKENSSLSIEEQEKLNRFIAEREECLRPVKIRTTGHDRDRSRYLNALPSNQHDLDDFDDDYEMEEEVVHTLLSINSTPDSHSDGSLSPR